MWSLLINHKQYWRIILVTILVYVIVYTTPKLVHFFPTVGFGEFIINAGHYWLSTFLSTLLLGLPFLLFGLMRSKLKYDLFLLLPCLLLSGLLFFWRKYGYLTKDSQGYESIGGKYLQKDGVVTPFGYWHSFENTLLFFSMFVLLIYLLIAFYQLLARWSRQDATNQTH